jgi:hypothetical protein
LIPMRLSYSMPAFSISIPKAKEQGEEFVGYQQNTSQQMTN